MNEKKTLYRAEIDGLRAIAVIAVIANHFDKSFAPNGHLGVDIFYVISGFVITQSLVSRKYDYFSDYIFEFYKRRIKRLFPVLFICVVITSTITLLVIAPNAPLATASLHTGASSLFGLSNIYLLRQATDYFGSSAELNPFTHTWSLGVEAQFYFLFPFLLWFGWIKKEEVFSYKKILLIIAPLSIISFASYLLTSKTNTIFAFYMMPTRFWEISAGTCAYIVLIIFKDKIPLKIAARISFPSLIIILWLLFIAKFDFNVCVKTLTIVFLTFVTITCTCKSSLSCILLTMKPVCFIGIISYSLYIWHWSIIVINRFTNSLPIFLQLMLLLFISIASYNVIEVRFRRYAWPVLNIRGFKISETAYSFVFSVIFSLAAAFIAIPIHRAGYLYTGKSAPLIKKGVESLTDTQFFKDYKWTAEKCVFSSNNQVGMIVKPEDCTFGDFFTAKRRFLVIGNSFSAAEIELYKIIASEGLGAVTVTSTWGASPIPEIENNTPWKKANEYYWSYIIPSLINSLKKGDVLLMINDGAGFSNSSIQMTNLLNSGLKRILNEMTKRGIFVIYQSGNPFMRESNCTPDTALIQWWHIFNNPPCKYYTREESLKRRQAYHDTLIALQDKFKNFFVLDLFDIFCPDTVCKFYNHEGVFLYRDEWSHPSVEASALAQPKLINIIRKIEKSELRCDQFVKF